MAKRKVIQSSTAEFKRRLKKGAKGKYVLRLYVTGMTPRSVTAIQNIKTICEKYLEGRYDLDVVDILKQPVLARGEQIVAVPTLVKKLPLPLRRFIGDLTDTERILLGLDIKKKNEAKGPPSKRTSG